MSKEVYIIRHAEKDNQGTITELGKEQAKQLSNFLPKFSRVISSDSPRTQETALILTGNSPIIDPRAGFYMAPQDKSDEVNRLSREKDISFLEAAVIFNDEEVNFGIEDKATTLNKLVDETLDKLADGEKALIVSHDLSISPAMRQRGIELESIPFLSGYIINETHEVTRFNR